ncbi:hypothetical protein CTEN210_03571 [Chaetoceros tenuissimus]|uniref:Leucine-rich repeat domain-containing protein n=1 Tax=Chaetoceros tenuissimus TaxID=426638 RepID=A0AAD3CJL8_9STRA|nr:hypothetical protein CTEN210_03571 [Chaetoceros tenuissimus]
MSDSSSSDSSYDSPSSSSSSSSSSSCFSYYSDSSDSSSSILDISSSSSSSDSTYLDSIQTEEWQSFTPGVRMYKGKKTLFYNGEILWIKTFPGLGHPLIYKCKERKSWQVVIILPGVEVIPEYAFFECKNVETVIMADSVQTIGISAFEVCVGLKFVRLSRSLDRIGNSAFYSCKGLTSISIPPSCRMITWCAFAKCRKLIILGLPQHTQLGTWVFGNTPLLRASPIELDENGNYDEEHNETFNEWIRSINNGDRYALHRACASYNPLPEIIHALVKRHGIEAMKMPNSIGITPSRYLAANPFADITEKDITNRYILDSMGEV